MRLLKQHSLLSSLNGVLIDLAVPTNISYNWGIGSSLALCLAIQIMTGFFLAQRYIGSVCLAFSSVDFIMREVYLGWIIRYLHAITASFFMTLTYIHLARGLYYESYKTPRQELWLSGCLIFILLMGTAFLGYTLPFGSMSLWGAVVITNLLSALPLIGLDLVHWIWGGFNVGNPTLTRFYSIHYLLPFIVASLTLVHFILLHNHGSTNPTGLSSGHNKVRFSPYFWLKDIVGWITLAFILTFFLFYEPDWLGHSDNFNLADPLVTPASIVPEFYFLAYYAILRAIPNKLGGVITMAAAIVILTTLPFTNQSKMRSAKFKPLQALFFWIFTSNFILLSWLGQCPVNPPYIYLAKISTIIYFSYFLTPISRQ